MAGLASFAGGFSGSTIGSAVVRLFLDSSQYEASLAKVKGETTAAAGGLSGTAKAASTAFIALGALAVVAIDHGIKATTEWASGVRSLIRVTGQSAESASALAGAAEHLGIGVDALNIGFGLLSKNIANGAPNLAKYGIAVKDTSGAMLPFDEILGRVQDKFGTLQPGAEQAAFAMNIFGRSGKALIPILQQGRDGLAALEAAARAAGLVMSQDDIDAAKALTLAQNDLSEAFKGASISLGKTFIPLATQLVDSLTKIVEVVSKIPEPVTHGVLAFVALTGAVAALLRVGGFFVSTWTKFATVLGLATKAETVAAAATLTNATTQEGLAAATTATTLTVEEQVIALQARNAALAAGGAATGFAASALAGGGLAALPAAGAANVVLPPDQQTAIALINNAPAAEPDPDGHVHSQLVDLAAASGLDAKATQLALDTHISYQSALALVNGTLTDTTAALTDTATQMENLGISTDAASRQFSSLAAISGQTSAEFQTAFTDAYTSAQDAALKANEAFDSTAAAEAAFATASQGAMDKAATAIAAFKASAVASLSQFTSDALTSLADTTNLTVDKVVASFNKAATATRQFGRDVLDISKSGGEAGKALAQQLLAMGPAAAGLASFIADASGKAKDRMIAAFGAGGTAADKAASKITDSIVGTLQVVQQLLEAIATRWGITLNLDDKAATAGVIALQNRLDGLHDKTVRVTVIERLVRQGL